MMISHDERELESRGIRWRRGQSGSEWRGEDEKEQNTNLILGSRSTNPAGSTC